MTAVVPLEVPHGSIGLRLHDDQVKAVSGVLEVEHRDGDLGVPEVAVSVAEQRGAEPFEPEGGMELRPGSQGHTVAGDRHGLGG